MKNLWLILVALFLIPQTSIGQEIDPTVEMIAKEWYKKRRQQGIVKYNYTAKVATSDYPKGELREFEYIIDWQGFNEKNKKMVMSDGLLYESHSVYIHQKRLIKSRSFPVNSEVNDKSSFMVTESDSKKYPNRMMEEHPIFWAQGLLTHRGEKNRPSYGNIDYNLDLRNIYLYRQDVNYYILRTYPLSGNSFTEISINKNFLIQSIVSFLDNKPSLIIELGYSDQSNLNRFNIYYGQKSNPSVHVSCTEILTEILSIANADTFFDLKPELGDKTYSSTITYSKDSGFDLKMNEASLTYQGEVQGNRIFVKFVVAIVSILIIVLLVFLIFKRTFFLKISTN